MVHHLEEQWVSKSDNWTKTSLSWRAIVAVPSMILGMKRKLNDYDPAPLGSLPIVERKRARFFCLTAAKPEA